MLLPGITRSCPVRRVCLQVAEGMCRELQSHRVRAGLQRAGAAAGAGEAGLDTDAALRRREEGGLAWPVANKAFIVLSGCHEGAASSKAPDHGAGRERHPSQLRNRRKRLGLYYQAGQVRRMCRWVDLNSGSQQTSTKLVLSPATPTPCFSVLRPPPTPAPPSFCLAHIQMAGAVSVPGDGSSWAYPQHK